MSHLEKYRQEYIQEMLACAEKLKPFIRHSDYENVIKRINKTRMYPVPLSALPAELIQED